MKKVLLLAAVLLCLLSSLAASAPLAKGSNLVAIQLTQGVADLVGPVDFSGYVTAVGHSELGGQIQYWHFVGDATALNLSVGIGTFAETDKPGTDAIGLARDTKFTQTSFSARIGMDRVGHVGDRFAVFLGPGLQVWNGRGKFTSGISPTGDWESVRTTRFALDARIGARYACSERFGMICQLGQYFGYASSGEDHGAKATWWPSGANGAFGVSFPF